MRHIGLEAMALLAAAILTTQCSGAGASPADNTTTETPSEQRTASTLGLDPKDSPASDRGSQTPAQQSDPTNDDCSKVVDTCPVPAGVMWQCKRRFMHGVNFAWHGFGSDFGGARQWGVPGVASLPEIDRELADMKRHGSNVIRWWIFADLRGDGITMDQNGTPTGLGGTFLADLNAALELAQRHDLYLMLTVFSFDGFRPTKNHSGRIVPGLRPIVVDDAKRLALMNNVIAPMAAAAEANPNRKRLIAWDLINEPEWAMSGPSMYGDPNFDPIGDMETVSHQQMETLLQDMTKTLRTHSRALVTVGAAAAKWKNAWSKLDLDFYQFHIYDWVNQNWPFHKSPTELGLGSKPVVMGEFPLTGLTGVTVPDMLNTWLANGYAGGLSWSVTDPNFKWHENKQSHTLFAKDRACETTY